MFPFKVRHSVDINSTSDETVLLNVQKFLRTNNVTDFYKAGNKVFFKVSIFGWSWDKFAAFEAGQFTVDKSRLTFEGTMYRMFVITLVFGLVVAFSTKVLIGIFFFAVLFIFNWLITTARFKKVTRDLTITADGQLGANSGHGRQPAENN